MIRTQVIKSSGGKDNVTEYFGVLVRGRIFNVLVLKASTSIYLGDGFRVC